MKIKGSSRDHAHATGSALDDGVERIADDVARRAVDMLSYNRVFDSLTDAESSELEGNIAWLIIDAFDQSSAKPVLNESSRDEQQ